MKRFIPLALLLASSTGFAADKPKDKFFSKKNLAIFTVLAGSMAADGYTTQSALNCKRMGNYEMNPIAKPFVKLGWGGQAVISSASFATVISSSYFLHRTGHKKFEKVIPIAVAGVSIFFARRNSKLY